MSQEPASRSVTVSEVVAGLLTVEPGFSLGGCAGKEQPWEKGRGEHGAVGVAGRCLGAGAGDTEGE